MNTAQMPPSPEFNLERVPELVEQLFRERAGAPTPTPSVKSNLLETWQSFWLQIAVPGIDLDSLQVQAVGRRVHLAGRFDARVIETAAYLRQELPVGEFAESFELPEEVEGRHAEAHFDGGILTIRLPKLSYFSPATIPVHCP
jgi:HSP20 family protein